MKINLLILTILVSFLIGCAPPRDVPSGETKQYKLVQVITKANGYSTVVCEGKSTAIWMTDVIVEYKPGIVNPTFTIWENNYHDPYARLTFTDREQYLKYVTVVTTGD